MNSEHSVALQVREGLARRRMSREQLAVNAHISLSALEKGMAGERPFTLATIVRLESALEVSLRARRSWRRVRKPRSNSAPIGAKASNG